MTLGDLFEITSSKRVFESDWTTVGVPFYRAREIVKLAKHGCVDNELFISESMFEQYSSKYGIPTAGDIMVTGVGTLGICYVVKDGDRFYFKDGNIIWLKKRSETHSRFVEYAFQSDVLRSQIDDSPGATVGTYTIIKAKGTRLPVPPLHEQLRIVGILDEAFDAIAAAKANTEKARANARALFESHLEAVFTQGGEGWVTTTLGDAFAIVTGNTPPKDRSEYYGQFMPFVKPPELCNAPFSASGDGLSVAGQAVARVLPAQSILVSCIGNLGKIGLNTVPVAFNQQINAVLPDGRKASPAFMLLQALSNGFRNQLEALATGTTVRIVNKSKFMRIGIVLPPMAQQEAIAEQVNAVREATLHLESLAAQKLAALDALKKSLLHQAFTGQLTARGTGAAARPMRSATHKMGKGDASCAHAETGA